MSASQPPLSSDPLSHVRPAGVASHLSNLTTGIRAQQVRRTGRRGERRSRFLGGWQLVDHVADGTYCSVHSARPLGCPPNRPADYVIKVLKPEYHGHGEARRVLSREAEVGRHSSHPNLVPILEAHLDDETPYLVMPRIDGAPLSRVIRVVGGVVLAQALWITRQVAQALAHLHQQGWVHGDIKPANIIVSRRGHATLIDLAFAMRSQESIYTTDRPLRATLAYVAPELLTSANATHPAADIYSLGVTLYEMIAGYVPFRETDVSKLVEAHLQAPPPRFDSSREIPADVECLVRQMLAKAPFRRPQSARELVSTLTNLEFESLDTRIA